MRDGTVLRADIYRPKEAGRFPVLLQRTPYNKAGEVDFGYRAAAEGYVVIVQDVRGRYTSEGEWYPFKHESQDGYDTIEWAAELPYSNGKVGMFGGSYVGATQMLAAIAHPPHLAGICPIVTASNYHNGWTYQGGAFEQWFNESWTSGLAQDTLNRRVQHHTNAMKGIWTLPLSNYPLFNLKPEDLNLDSPDSLAPYFQDWLAHPDYDEYWKRWSIEEHYQDIKVPVLTIAAWYDIFQGGSLRNYEGIKAHGGSEAARKMNLVADNVITALKAKREDVTKKRADYVGSAVGDELKSDGIVAVIFVIIGIMIYIGIRFEWRFAVAAIASEIHDTLITVGFYAVTQHEFDITVLASVLAVVGYSINDKVVVFDRVRELFRATRKGEPVEILNKAINSTLSRTIITSVFTGITMIALYFLGGPAVHGFALTMIIGIVIGTLSSIFFASPILLWLGVSKKDLMPVTRDNPELARRP